jgi:hypothetical protein
MESIIQQLNHLDISPVFVNLFPAITQPFVHGFQTVEHAFEPFIKPLVLNEPGLIGGVFFVLLSYSFAMLLQNLKKAEVVVTIKKPSPVYKEGFPSSLDIQNKTV